MTMFASAATPIVRIRPAMPGSVSVIGMSLISAKKYSAVDEQREHGDDAEHAVEDQQEQRDDAEADGAGEQALVERLLAERRGDLRLRDQLEACTGSAPVFRRFASSCADWIVKPPWICEPFGAVDAVRVLDEVDVRRRDELVVEDDREVLARGVRRRRRGAAATGRAGRSRA